MSINENTKFNGNVWWTLWMIFAIASSVWSFAFSYIGYNYRITSLETDQSKVDIRLDKVEEAIVRISTMSNDIEWIKKKLDDK